MRFSWCVLIVALSVTCSAGMAFGAPMILNEYNGVGDTDVLKNEGSDTHFGQVPGNGGDWMEFVIIQDMLDVRGWTIRTVQDGSLDATILLPQYDAFAALRSGTILTVAELVATDLGYDPIFDSGNPDAGDWCINYQAAFSAGNNTHKDFQVTIVNASGGIVFGPAGEGISPVGIGRDEVFKLEANPSDLITPNSTYNDGTTSTFGSPNQWSGGDFVQDFSELRSTVVPEPSSLVALAAGLGSLWAFRRRQLARDRHLP